REVGLQYSSTCSLCSHLMTDHDIEHHDYGEAPCKLEDCSCRGVHAQFHTDITVLGLKKTYKINEPVKFALKIQGYSPGGFMTLSIRKDDGPEIWQKKYFSNNQPGFSPHPFDLTYNLPAEEEPLTIRDSGRYVLAVSVNQHQIEEKFTAV
ncbi:MAG: hypothetical protein KGI27_14750, partial [Thaumarchaeota archaeon]|nr:hypothetical protein [Nitrososphaerota archaeon]